MRLLTRSCSVGAIVSRISVRALVAWVLCRQNAAVGYAQVSASSGRSVTLQALTRSNSDDRKALLRARAALLASNYKRPEILSKQSFRVMGGATSVGVLVTGIVQAKVDSRNRDCFVTVVAGEVPTIVVPDQWEGSLISCDGVRSVGVLQMPNGNTDVHIGIVFHTGVYLNELRNSGYDQYDAVVFAWNATTHRLDVDRESTEKVFKAGATTLPELQQALQ